MLWMAQIVALLPHHLVINHFGDRLWQGVVDDDDIKYSSSNDDGDGACTSFIIRVILFSAVVE